MTGTSACELVATFKALHSPICYNRKIPAVDDMTLKGYGARARDTHSESDNYSDDKAGKATVALNYISTLIATSEHILEGTQVAIPISVPAPFFGLRCSSNSCEESKAGLGHVDRRWRASKDSTASDIM